MQENALYLDLVARELADHGHLSPETLIQRIADNPENIFSLATERLKRQWDLWREVIKPVLGVLLVVQEPLTKLHLRLLIGVDADHLNLGLERLGGLVIDDGRQRYSLYHLKFRDYLSEDLSRQQKQYIFAQDEVEYWHRRLVQWCEQSDIVCIWDDIQYDEVEQGRRIYARRHFVTHLYLARQWQLLFDLLDAGLYGHEKILHDPSMRAYTRDLEYGQQVAAWEGWTFETAISYLPRLWQYSLLRSSLASRADRYPDEAFQLLLILDQEVQALGLAELLTNPLRKIEIILLIAHHLKNRPRRDAETWQLFDRASEIINTIKDSQSQARALRALGVALAQAHRWKQATEVVDSIRDSQEQARALCGLSEALVQAQQWEQARQVWEQAEQVIGSIEDSQEQMGALEKLSEALAQAQQWEKLLRLTQRSWQYARTREDALRLFSLSNELISCKPELGEFLYEAFTKVDVFLRG